MSRPRRRIRVRFRDVRLFWKLLIPFLVLLLLLGGTGMVVIVRSIAARADASLERDLSRRSLDALVYVRDREQDLLESVIMASSFEGLATAVRTRNVAALARFETATLEFRPSLRLMATLDAAGVTLLEYRRSPENKIARTNGSSWRTSEPVAATLRDGARGLPRAGIVRNGGDYFIASAAPVPAPAAVGDVVVAMRLDDVVNGAAERAGTDVFLYDAGGTRIAAAGPSADIGAQTVRLARKATRSTVRFAGETYGVLDAPLEIAGIPVGMIGVRLPTAPAFAGVRAAAKRLAMVFALAMIAVVAVGAWLSRSIVGQVRPLVVMNQSLADGDLSARTPVFGGDEFGQLAAGFNLMADRLEASHRDLELRVEERTAQLRRANRALSRTSEAQAEFFTAMAHEFRAPLFAIIGHADMLQDREYAATSVRRSREFGSTIKGAGQHVLRLINEILDLAKADAGRMQLDLAPVSLGEVIGEVTAEMESLAIRSQLALKDTVPDDLVVSADRTRLKEILLNLISNAVTHTPAGGWVRISASRRGERVEVKVADSGSGIPRSAHGRIFEPFYQVAQNGGRRPAASSGLGLALVKRLVEAHGGTIRVSSVPGRGSTFTFSLSAADARVER